MAFFLVIAASISCNSIRSTINPSQIKGDWYLNKWASYHTLKFYNSTVFVDNNIDTVFTLNYSITNDTLLLWSKNPNKKKVIKLIKLTKDILVIEGIEGVPDKRSYTRIMKPF